MTTLASCDKKKPRSYPLKLGHPLCRTFWNCLRLSKPWGNLHYDIARLIFEKSDNIRKQARINSEEIPYCGTSRSARKRRAKFLRICIECGQSLENHRLRCKMSNTPAQEDRKKFCQLGHIRMVAEKLIRPGSEMYYFMRDEMNWIRGKRIPRLQNLTLKDLGLEGEWNVQLPNLDPNYLSGDESE